MSGGCFSTAVRGDQPADIVFAACAQGSGFALAYFPQDGRYASPNTYSVYRNQDGSTSNWQMVLSAPEMGPTVLAIAPTAPSTVYALATDNNPNSPFYYALAGLYGSDSSGDPGTWQQRAGTSSPNSITANILSYPQYGQGCTYNTAQGHHGQGGWNLGLAVDPSNSQTLFVAGPRMSRSTDGGRTFGILFASSNSATGFTPTDYHSFAFHPAYNGASNQTIFVTQDGGIYRSDVALTPSGFIGCGTDQFYSLIGAEFNNGLQIAQFYSGAAAPGGAYYVGGTQDTVTLTSTPGQTGWRAIYNGDGGMVAIDAANPQTFYFESTAAPSSPQLMKTTDAGTTKTWVAGGISGGAGNSIFNGLATDPTNPQTVYLGLSQLWRSQDGAATWSAIGGAAGGAFISAIGVNPVNSAEVIFGDVSGNISRGSPNSFTSVQPRTGYVSSLVFDRNNSGVLYATFSTFRTNPTDAQVYLSTDHGATWSPLGIPGLPDIPVHVLAVDPDSPSSLYIGTDMGLFVSYNAGKTWSHDNSFPNVITESFSVDAGPTGHQGRYLYAFTHGRGAWRVKLTGGSPRSGPSQ